MAPGVNVPILSVLLTSVYLLLYPSVDTTPVRVVLSGSILLDLHILRVCFLQSFRSSLICVYGMSSLRNGREEEEEEEEVWEGGKVEGL